MIKKVFLALLAAPFTVTGFVLGFVCRPLYAGFVYGFDYTFNNEVKVVGDELVKRAKKAD